jgi:hypothetical protein
MSNQRIMIKAAIDALASLGIFIQRAFFFMKKTFSNEYQNCSGFTRGFLFSAIQANKAGIALAFCMTAILLSIASPVTAMTEMADKEMSNVSGQALLQMDKEFTNGFTFYKAGLDAKLELNTNFEKLQLGCGGVNGPGACDLDIDNFSLGCVADSSGACLSLDPRGRQIPGAPAGTASQLKDFLIERPFFQFAIKNDNSKTLREVVGIRLGGEDVSGPLSFGSLNTFSGYMSGQANLEMQGADNVAITCAYADRPCVAPGADTSGMNNGGASSWGSPPAACGFFGCNRAGLPAPEGGYLNLGDDMILDIGIASIRFQEALVSYGTVTRNGNSVLLSGNRQNQAAVSGIELGGVVNSLVYGNNDGSTNVGASPLELADTDAGALVGIFGPTLLPLLRGGVSDQIKRQLAAGLRIYDPNEATNQAIINSKSDGAINTDLNNYDLPFNVTNVHQIDVTSDLFGLSFQKEDVQYPGYVESVKRGWAMYAPDAFTLDIAQPVTTFVSGITGSSAARDGNIVGLEPPFKNCWGSARFC